MLPFLFVFAQAHDEFRLPELESISELHGFTIKLPDSPEDRDPNRPFMVLHLEKVEHAILLAERCILVKSVYEFYAQGSTYDELHDNVRTASPLWEQYTADSTFKFVITSHNHALSQSRQRALVESFAYMEFLGKIDMKNPEIVLGCFLEYADTRGISQDSDQWEARENRTFKQAYFGKLLVEGTARSLIATFDVKKRVFFGNTSMEAQISLLMANQTMASPGKLIYDPFMGTGSMAYPSAYFGAQFWGSDIDGRQMRGKGNQPGIYRAAEQYGVASRLLDLCTFDVTRNPWRCGELFDAIVTDPPYGVRAGAKRLGRKPDSKPKAKPNASDPRVDPNRAYIPPTKPYELSDLARDLVLLARYLLKPKGRLVFFLPTVTDEYADVDIDTMMCEGMEVVANSLQDFGSWGRRLVTIRKTTDQKYPRPTFEPPVLEEEDVEGDKHVPAHRDFRDKYFGGFKKVEVLGEASEVTN